MDGETDDILESIAVARRTDTDAATILNAYIATNPTMALVHAPTAPAPAASGARAPVPGGSAGGGGSSGAAIPAEAEKTEKTEKTEE